MCGEGLARWPGTQEALRYLTVPVPSFLQREGTGTAGFPRHATLQHGHRGFPQGTRPPKSWRGEAEPASLGIPHAQNLEPLPFPCFIVSPILPRLAEVTEPRALNSRQNPWKNREQRSKPKCVPAYSKRRDSQQPPRGSNPNLQ